MRYVILSEHTADQYIRAFGKNLEEAFENAGLALFDTMTNLKDIKAEEEYTIRTSGEDIESLLYNYIEELIVAFEITGLLFSQISVVIVEKEKHFSLIAKLKGEVFDQDKHLQKVGVKAMTYCRMKILRGKETILEFVIDI